MRGTEGEPVADARRLQKMDIYIGGIARPELSLPGQTGVVTELPVLPRSSDAPSTARWIQAIVSGAMPAPAAVTAQVDCLVRALGRARPAGEPEGFGLRAVTARRRFIIRRAPTRRGSAEAP